MSAGDTMRVRLPELPALVVGTVHHTRFQPTRRSFTHEHYQWLIDLESPPELRGGSRLLAGFHAEDHLDGEPGLPALRASVLARVGQAGIATTSIDRVVMLAHARVLGHVFNPMTAFWCLDATGGVVAVVVEVHNTYGERHAYVVVPDHQGRATVDKAFYVSPFNDTEGTYDLTLRLSPERSSISIRLHRRAQPVLVATVTGECHPATRRALLRTALRQPLMTHRVSALIRRHGIALWAGGLPIQERPTAARKEVVR